MNRLGWSAMSLLPVALTLVGGLADAAEVPTMIRGSRAVLLRPEPGPLTIRITKRDLNIYEGEDTLTARLFGPLAEELAMIELPDDGSAEKSGISQSLQSAEMTAESKQPGLYRLLISGSHDLTFGFETSCERYVIDGDVMLNDGSVATPVCFQPPQGAFNITAQAIHQPGLQQLPLKDARGDVVHTFDFTKPGEDVTFDVAADAGDRTGLWTFDVQKADIKAHIDGVAYWTADPNAYFSAAKTRWMLLPRRAMRYVRPGGSAEIPFILRNRTGEPTSFRVTVDHDPGLDCRLDPVSPIALGKDGRQALTVSVAVPQGAEAGDAHSAFLTVVAEADPLTASASAFEFRVGESPISRNLDMPIILQRYRHEDVQFGYAPDYVTNDAYFDLRNRPFIRERTESMYRSTGIMTLEGGEWTELPFASGLDEQYPGWSSSSGAGGFLGAKVAFDGDNDAYTLMKIKRSNGRTVNVLIHRPTDSDRYFAYELPGQSFDIEQFTGHNALDIPPPVLAYVQTAPHAARFCSYNDLLLFLPKKQDGKLTLGEPVKVTDKCLGSCQHSGGPASTATRDGKTHIVWGEVTGDTDPGVPTHIATFDHASGTLGEKVLLAYGPPVNDVHNVPAICQDAEGYIHVVSGAHGQSFKYVRSLAPNDAYSGFTDPVEVLSAGYIDENTDDDGAGRQTYISLVCGPDDTLHIAFRQWRYSADDYLPDSVYAALSVQSKPKDGPWGPARPLVIPPVPGYSIWYHKLTVDRRGRLYLSYNHWTSDATYQDEFPGRYTHRAVIVSRDAGKSWKLAETRDFIEGMR